MNEFDILIEVLKDKGILVWSDIQKKMEEQRKLENYAVNHPKISEVLTKEEISFLKKYLMNEVKEMHRYNPCFFQAKYVEAEQGCYAFAEIIERIKNLKASRMKMIREKLQKALDEEPYTCDGFEIRKKPNPIREFIKYSKK